MKTTGLFLTFTFALLLGACGVKKEAATQQPVPEITPKYKMVGGGDYRATLRATVFRMSGDYADNVAVTLNDDGSLAYYPAPSDLGQYSAPLALEDGWYLNRQGLGPKSVFTTYTFEEYRNLPAAPSQSQLLEAVIPGAVVTEFRELPLESSDAIANPSLCIQYLNGQ